MTTTQLFYQILNTLAEQYPNAELSVRWDYDRNVVYAYGKEQFCPDGFNFLYNLQRLTNILKDELR